MKRIGILGGTFNPIHKGHIALAKFAAKKFRLENVVFIPTGIPPHKNIRGIAKKEHRLRMCSLAIKKIPKFKISKIEINRKGYSYAVDTFKKLRRSYGKDSELYYIMGLDSINDILNWKKPLELFKLCKFIIATRPGSKLRTFKRIMKFPPVSINRGKIKLIELNMKISSTDIRKKIKTGKNIARFVPKAVAEYIPKHNLYRK